MPSEVTVIGAHGPAVSVPYDSATYASIAAKLAAAIKLGVENGTVSLSSHTEGSPTTAAVSAAGGPVLGGTAPPSFIGGQASATIFGASGSTTVLGAGGATTAGGGSETLFGASPTGNDQVLAGSGADRITAATGADTLVAASGAATLHAGAVADVFALVKGETGGTDLTYGTGAPRDVHITFVEHDPQDATLPLAPPTSGSGAVTVTLSDATRITFQNAAHLDRNMSS